MRHLARWSLVHRRLVLVGWVGLAIVAFFVGSTTGSNFATAASCQAPRAPLRRAFSSAPLPASQATQNASSSRRNNTDHPTSDSSRRRHDACERRPATRGKRRHLSVHRRRRQAAEPRRSRRVRNGELQQGRQQHQHRGRNDVRQDCASGERPRYPGRCPRRRRRIDESLILERDLVSALSGRCSFCSSSSDPSCQRCCLCCRPGSRCSPLSRSSTRCRTLSRWRASRPSSASSSALVSESTTRCSS